MARYKQVELRVPVDVQDELNRRIDGTRFTLSDYINALLTVMVVEMVARERAEMRQDRPAEGRQRQKGVK